MLYEVKLSPEELDALASLLGRRLDRVLTDGWAVELRSDQSVLSVVPEEVPTPDADHRYADVERPKVQMAGEPALSEKSNLLAERLGVVRAINVVSTLIGFSPVVVRPAEQIMPGVVLPEGRGYGWIYYPPRQRSEAEREVGADQALVDLDIAFEVVTDACPSLVLYTQGFFVRVSRQGLPANEDWVSLGSFVRRALASDGRLTDRFSGPAPPASEF